MDKINIREIVGTKYNTYLVNYPVFIRNLILGSIEKILYIEKINKFIEAHKDKIDFAFLDEIFEYLDFSFSISSKDKDKIPSEGRLIIVANHPLGGLDGLVLLKLIREVRPDIKIVVNDILANITNLSGLFLPYDIINNHVQKSNLNLIGDALKNEKAVIIFPSGTVSRFGLKGIKDISWNKGAIYFAEKYNAPVLPVFINARNSILFYAVSLFHKNFSMLLLVHELFNKKGKTISVKIGNHISSKIFSSNLHTKKILSKLLRKHVYTIGKNKKGIFKTEKNVIHPVDRKILKKQLAQCEQLGTTEDGMKIILASFQDAPEAVKEIGRLREITFRKVGEGTGSKVDRDFYDTFYKHLVLWDEKELEIAGSYRIGICNDIIHNYGLDGLYTGTLFKFADKLINILPDSIELGRSFIQSKYWNTNALDYLWQGIGAFLFNNPQIKFMFGAVSMSSIYSVEAKNMIVNFYNRWFGTDESYAEAFNKFIFSKNSLEELDKIFPGKNYKEDLILLKKRLRIYGYSIPILYKQYSELCEPGGVKFIGFGIDAGFNNCVDGFILAEVYKIKPEKKQRYIYKNKVETEILS